MVTSNGSNGSSRSGGSGREGEWTKERMRVDYLLNGPSSGRGSGNPKVKSSSRDAMHHHRHQQSREVRQSLEQTHAGAARSMSRTDGSTVGSKADKKGGGPDGEKRRFSCEICGFAFAMRSNLKRHVVTVHEERRGFKCGLCGSAFGLKQNLATHVRVKHEKSRPYGCEVCGQRFGYKQVLQNHQKNIHGRDKARARS